MYRKSSWSIVLGNLTVAACLVSSGLPAEASEFDLKIDPLVLEGLWLDQDTDSSRFQEYRDLSDGFRVQLNLAGATPDQKRSLAFQVINGGRDDGFYGLSYDVAGSWRIALSLDNIPHRFGNNGKILWGRGAPGSWELPDPVQRDLQEAVEDQLASNPSGVNFAFLNGLLQPYLTSAANSIDLALKRRRTQASLEIGHGGRALWQLEYRHEARDGLRALGTSFGFGNAIELPETIDFDTSDASLSGTWKWTRGIVTAGLRYSLFENNISTLYWDNPFRVSDATDPSAYTAPGTRSAGGSSRGFSDLAADNEMSGVFANARFDVGARGWLQASINWSRFEQDDRLLPMTLNGAIGEVLQPYDTARREADMLRVAVDYGGRFGDGWQIGVRYNYQDYSDDSPRFVFEEGYVRFHAVLEEIPRITVPFSWTRETISASVDKDLGAAGNVGLEVKRDTWERDNRETEKTTEDILILKWDGRLGPVMLRAKLEHDDREIDGAYETEAQELTFVHPEGINNLPGMRKYDQAARKTDIWNLSATVPIAQVWVLQAHASGTDLDFHESEFGLTRDETVRYGFDLSREIGSGGSFFLFAERADRTVEMDSRQSGASPSTNPLDSWFVDFDELNDSWGLGWSKVAARWQASIRAERVESDGKADMFSPPGGTPNLAMGFDDYEDYERVSVRGDFDHDLSANLALGVGVLYEDFTIDSFIRNNLKNYLPAAILLLADDGEYTAWSGVLRLKVRF